MQFKSFATNTPKHYVDDFYKYGTFQIDDEINVPKLIGYDNQGNEKYGPKYGDLHNMLTSFKKDVQAYYNKHIVSDLLKYELLK